MRVLKKSTSVKILPAMGNLFNRVGIGRLSSQWGHNQVIRNPEPNGFFSHGGRGTVLGVTPDIDLIPSHTVLLRFVTLLRHFFLFCLRVLTYKIETLSLLQVIITVTFYFTVLSFFKALMEKHFCLSNNTLNSSKSIYSLRFFLTFIAFM